MVSSSGPDSDWSFFAAIGRLGPTVAFMAFVGALALGSIEISRIAFERSVAQHATNECSKQRDKAGCQSATAEIRSALAAEHAVQLGVWQTAFNFFGLVGLFFTVVYAKRAWLAARSSAEADNNALELNRIALKEQREAMRPYMVFTSGNFSAKCGEYPETEIIIKFKNTGSVPAFIKGQVLYQWNTTLIDSRGYRTDAGSWSEFAVDIVAPGSEHEISSGRGFPGCKFVVSGGIIVGVRLQYGAFGMFWDETTWLQANWSEPNGAGNFRPEAPPR